MTPPSGRDFWTEAFAWHGSVTPRVLPHVVLFGGFAAIVCVLTTFAERRFDVRLALEEAPFEIAGAALGLILIMRTNAGHERWWEARKLWGGIVNQSRNLAISALTYGPENEGWREGFVRWAAAFPHVARCSLRAQRALPEVAALLGPQAAEEISRSEHMPSTVALALADRLREACEHFSMDRFAFMQIDRERAALIDHVGACERILKTPPPLVYVIKIRRFIALFLLMLPFALLHRIKADWLIPFITMLVSYPLLALDQIGLELQNPFEKQNLSHLPLGEISADIESNLLGLLSEKRQSAGSAR